jgi:hypothetical protein|tara:strand:- start:1 stop:180 length:180 start_codon:yes stop_codon:yes gene_type:complete
MTNEEEEKEVLNNDNTEINKGFELLLRNRRKEKPKSKTFQIQFSFFGREITFYLDIQKK